MCKVTIYTFQERVNKTNSISFHDLAKSKIPELETLPAAHRR